MFDSLKDCVYIMLIFAAFVVGLYVGCVLVSGPKFCPECGDRYGNKVIYCSHCGVELLERRTGN